MDLFLRPWLFPPTQAYGGDFGARHVRRGLEASVHLVHSLSLMAVASLEWGSRRMRAGAAWAVWPCLVAHAAVHPGKRAPSPLLPRA